MNLHNQYLLIQYPDVFMLLVRKMTTQDGNGDHGIVFPETDSRNLFPSEFHPGIPGQNTELDILW